MNEKGIKALFIDEFEQDYDMLRWIKDNGNDFDILWIALECWILTEIWQRQEKVDVTTMKTLEKFRRFNLSMNLRNSRQIIDEINLLETSEVGRRHLDKILAPSPSNFPSGCPPVHAKSIKEAIKTTRRLTNEGILILILDNSDHIVFRIADKLKTELKGETYKFFTDGYVKIHDYDEKGGLRIYNNLNLKCDFNGTRDSPFEYLVNGNILVQVIKRFE